jgi:hypothetical protein
MARTVLFAALLLVGLASAGAFDLSDLPPEALDFVKDKVRIQGGCAAGQQLGDCSRALYVVPLPSCYCLHN